MILETKLVARFINPNDDISAEEIISLNALNTHTEAVAEQLQTAFRLLIVEMLELKRHQYAEDNPNA
jgi:hypothetical protein